MATKPLKDMTMDELLLERERLLYWVKNAKGNYIAVKQNRKTLDRVNNLISKLASNSIKQ